MAIDRKTDKSLARSINEGDSRSLEELMQPLVAKENMQKTISKLLSK